MRPVGHPVVITDQYAMKFNRLLNAAASLPMVFAEPSLNSEMTFYQIQPRPPFFIHIVTNAEPFVDAYPIAIYELAAMIRNDFFPRSEEHTSELQSLRHLVCRLLLEKKK